MNEEVSECDQSWVTDDDKPTELCLRVLSVLLFPFLNTFDNRTFSVKRICTNLTSNAIFSLAIVGILTADVYTENLL